MLGTFAHRTARLGDGLMVFLTDVTEQRRMEADLRGYADVVAHDLREPVANMALLVRVLGGWRSAAGSWRRTAAASGLSRRTAAAAPSASRCRSSASRYSSSPPLAFTAANPATRTSSTVAAAPSLTLLRAISRFAIRDAICQTAQPSTV
jgi:hypothetical protein